MGAGGDGNANALSPEPRNSTAPAPACSRKPAPPSSLSRLVGPEAQENPECPLRSGFSEWIGGGVGAGEG